MNEKLVRFKLLSTQNGTAVVELTVLDRANHSMLRRVRLDAGMSINLDFDTSFSEDKVELIGAEVRKAMMKARMP